MKNKKGFTLMELLAVITVLAIIGSITMISYTKVKKTNSEKEFTQIVNSIESLGPVIYSHELLAGKKDNDNYFYPMYKKLSSSNKSFIVELSELCNKGYLNNCVVKNSITGIKSPFDTSEICEGYLLVTKDEDNTNFKTFLKCGSKKESNEYESKKDGLSKALLTQNN